MFIAGVLKEVSRSVRSATCPQTCRSYGAKCLVGSPAINILLLRSKALIVRRP
jgi:hypothetical protein